MGFEKVDKKWLDGKLSNLAKCINGLDSADMEAIQVAEAVAGVPTGDEILVYAIRDKDTGVVTYYDQLGNVLVAGQDFIIAAGAVAEELSTTEVRAILEFDDSTAHAQNIITKEGVTMTPSSNTDGSFIIPDGTEKFYIFAEGTVTIDGLEYTDYVENQEDSGSLNRATTIAFVAGQIATVLVTYQVK